MGEYEPEPKARMHERMLSIPSCQFGVFSQDAYDDGYTRDCGEPAVAYLWWGKDERGLYACSFHYQEAWAEEDKYMEGFYDEFYDGKEK